MQVKDIMTPAAECTSPSASLQEVAERMTAKNIGCLPVCDNDRLVGMITDRDITVRSVSEGHDPQTDHVRDVMTPEVIYCFEDQDITEAAHLMEEKQIRRLPVLNRDKRMVGIVSLGDLAVRGGNDRLSGETIERVSEPTASTAG